MPLERKKKRKILNNLIPDWITGNGIMSYLTLNYPVPWASVYSGESIALDMAYQGARS